MTRSNLLILWPTNVRESCPKFLKSSTNVVSEETCHVSPPKRKSQEQTVNSHLNPMSMSNLFEEETTPALKTKATKLEVLARFSRFSPGQEIGLSARKRCDSTGARLFSSRHGYHEDFSTHQ